MRLNYLLLTTAAFLLSSSLATGQTWLWAWDRSEDLRWVEQGVGVAYFAAQFEGRGDQFVGHGRRPVLRVRPDTPLKPVIHIEAFYRSQPLVMTDQTVQRWADELERAIRRFGVKAVQLDFEARAGQRDFYTAVLRALRKQLPENTHVSITALASWCGDPVWLTALPVDEVVPMYFRMGPTERKVWRERAIKPESLPAVCRAAAGIATDEWAFMAPAWGNHAVTTRLQPNWYVFAPQSWRPQHLDGLPGWVEWDQK